jgi:hypothetical protein
MVDQTKKSSEAAPETEITALPMKPAPFSGVVGKTYKDSTSDFPQPLKPAVGAPNVLLVLIDDLGFGGTSTTFRRCLRS